MKKAGRHKTQTSKQANEQTSKQANIQQASLPQSKAKQRTIKTHNQSDGQADTNRRIWPTGGHTGQTGQTVRTGQAGQDRTGQAKQTQANKTRQQRNMQRNHHSCQTSAMTRSIRFSFRTQPLAYRKRSICRPGRSDSVQRRHKLRCDSASGLTARLRTTSKRSVPASTCGFQCACMFPAFQNDSC